ncbi:MAG: peptidoglycan-binding domain-containing protein [Pseudomonadota bacterium]
MRRVLSSIFVFILSAGLSLAQTVSDPLFQSAKSIYDAAQSKSADQRQTDYESVAGLLNLIVQTQPQSDLARSIQAQAVIDGLDVAVVSAAARSARPELALPSAPLVPSPQAGTLAAQQAPQIGNGLAPAPGVDPLALQPQRSEKEIVQDLQTTLNTLGCGAGTPDGVAGKKTRRAFGRFLKLTASPIPAEDYATEGAVQAVRQAIATHGADICNARWAFANAPYAMGQNWGFRADCQLLFRKVRVTGSMDLNVIDNQRFNGTIRNSRGYNGRISGSVRGNSVSAVMNWSNGLRETATLYMSRNSLTVSGKNSSGCDVVAWKS